MEIRYPRTVDVPEFKKFYTYYQSVPMIDIPVAMELASRVLNAKLELIGIKSEVFLSSEGLHKETKRQFSVGIMANRALDQKSREAAALLTAEYNAAADADAVAKVDLEFINDLIKACDMLYYNFRDMYRMEINGPAEESFRT